MVRSAALQHDFLEETDKSAIYYVGDDIGGANEEHLMVIGEGVIEQRKNDALPGITDTKEAEIEAAFEKWETEVEAQGTHQSQKVGSNQTLAEEIRRITRFRQAIQLAADGLSAWEVEANKLQRENFNLPSGRPYRPRRAKVKA